MGNNVTEDLHSTNFLVPTLHVCIDKKPCETGEPEKEVAVGGSTLRRSDLLPSAICIGVVDRFAAWASDLCEVLALVVTVGRYLV